MQNKGLITLHINTHEYFSLAFKGPVFKKIFTAHHSIIQIIWRFRNPNWGTGQASFSRGETSLTESAFRARQ